MKNNYHYTQKNSYILKNFHEVDIFKIILHLIKFNFEIRLKINSILFFCFILV